MNPISKPSPSVDSKAQPIEIRPGAQRPHAGRVNPGARSGIAVSTASPLAATHELADLPRAAGQDPIAAAAALAQIHDEAPLPPPERDPPKELEDLSAAVLQHVGGFLTTPEMGNAAQVSKWINVAMTDRAEDPLLDRVYQAQTRLRLLQHAGAPERDLLISRQHLENAQLFLKVRDFLQAGADSLQRKFFANPTDECLLAADLLAVLGRSGEAEDLLKWGLPQALEADDDCAYALASALVRLQFRMGKHKDADETAGLCNGVFEALGNHRSFPRLLAFSFTRWPDKRDYEALIDGLRPLVEGHRLPPGLFEAAGWGRPLAAKMLASGVPQVGDVLASIRFDITVPL